ncbi:hypothetical protein CPB85DRAFT_1329861 [Mucidula mucida]|nr:hypothetical protein CPB85DRAFT_1329861 [Mucidula mucida]
MTPSPYWTCRWVSGETPKIPEFRRLRWWYASRVHKICQARGRVVGERIQGSEEAL